MRFFTLLPIVPALILLAACAGCGGGRDGSPRPAADARFIELDLEKRATDDIVGYYMGAYVPPGPSGAFEERLAVREGDRYYVDLDRFREIDSLSATALGRIAGDDRLVDWAGFSAFLSQTYVRARQIPDERQSLYDDEDFSGDPEVWMHLDVLGVMSTHRRRVFVRKADVLEALRAYRDNEDRIIYPGGTVFIAEHLDDGGVTETTVMRKSSSGYWDFFAYDSTGVRADSTLPAPRSRQVPTQCVGCHFGDKLYEPERSFPAEAEAGPHGPRQVFVTESLRDPKVVRYFDEHRKRSDGILGLYATILVSQLRSEQEAGSLDQESTRLLNALGL